MNNFNLILWIALLLIIIWIIAAITKFIAGAALNVILIIAIILFIVWLLRKIF